MKSPDALVRGGADESLPERSRRGVRPYTITLFLPRSRDCFSRLAVGGSAAFGFALVPELPTFGQGKLQLHSAVLEVHADGNQSKTLLLGLADQFADLFSVDQQFPGPQ